VYLPHHLALLVHFPHNLAVLVCSTTLTLWRGSLHPTPMFKCGIQPALSLTWHQICRPGFEFACVCSRLHGRRVKEKQYVAGLGYRGRLGIDPWIGLQSIVLQSIGLQCCVGANHEIAPTGGLLNSAWHFELCRAGSENAAFTSSLATPCLSTLFLFPSSSYF